MAYVPHPLPQTVDEISVDICNRWEGLKKALTCDSEALRDSYVGVEEAALYGFPDCTWKVLPPPPEVPAMLPEPLRGILYDGSGEFRHWLKKIGIHCDLWLLKVAFFFANEANLNKDDKLRLFKEINELAPLRDWVESDGDVSENSADNTGSDSRGKPDGDPNGSGDKRDSD